MLVTHHHHMMTDVAMPHHQSNNRPHRCEATTTGTELPHRSQQRGCQTMDNDEVGPTSPLLFANPEARCHVSDVATGQRMIIVRHPISTQHNTMATRAHHHPPRQWPITTPSIGNEDPGPAPPHHPTNTDNGPSPPHQRQTRPSTTP